MQLAGNLHPQEVRPGIAVATVTGTLVTKDNRYTLEPLDFTAAPAADSERYTHIISCAFLRAIRGLVDETLRLRFELLPNLSSFAVRLTIFREISR